MPEDRYSRVFSRLAAAREGAFVPFAVLGDPDPETSLSLLSAMAAGGADMLELGIPFSDPVADGPAIQAADARALKAGTTPAMALEIIAEFRRRHAALPIGLLLYANLVQRPGPAAFYRRAGSAGADSALVADLPLDEAASFARAAGGTGVAPVFMVAPNTSGERLRRIAAQPAPYLYVVSRTGVTGKDRDLAASARPTLRRIARAKAPPTLLGFGISCPSQVRAALAAGADGAISGSAIAELIASRPRRVLLSEIRNFVGAMKAATCP